MILHVESRGYVPHGDLAARFEDMRQSFEDAIDIYMEEMSKAMHLENAELDTVENYKHESMICAGESKRGR
jgi:uncharacterized protein YeaO (DUF488 family)